MAARPRVKPPSFTEALVSWYSRNRRDLPWRHTSDPYRIWISEIMLQQTRARTAIPYYQRFLERFPDWESLALASEPDVLTLWSGLGYYSRARLLLKAARRMAAAGGFPRDYGAIRAMAGVGDYTAAAIASIAFGLPHAVVDGNVLRVVARVAGDAADIGSARTRGRFAGIAQSWLDERDPGRFNQALMELGAVVCLPRNPLCGQCPVSAWCRSRQSGTTAQLPVKLRRAEPVRIEGTLLIVFRGGRTLLRRRSDEARRMAGFWDLPAPEDLPGAMPGERLGAFRHTITHHCYTFTVLEARWTGRAGAGFGRFTRAEMSGIPLSTTARKALKIAGIL